MRSFLVRIIENQPPFDSRKTDQKKRYERTPEEYHDEVEMNEMDSGDDEKENLKTDDDRL